MRRRREIAALLATVVSAACAERAPGPGSDLDTWAVAPVPITSIGVVDGDPEYLFQRLTAALFTIDGHIVVADGGLLVLREYAPDGAFLRRMGREGDGPGEFRSLRGIWTDSADTIGVWDAQALRLTYFGPDRTVARTVGLEAANATLGAGGLDFLAGVFPDRSVALGTVALGTAASAGGPGPDRVTIEHFSAHGDHLGRLVETTGLVRARLGEGLMGPVAFSPYPHVRTHAGVLYHANGVEPIVREWSPTGERAVVLPAHAFDVEREWSALLATVQERGLEPYVRVVQTAPRPERIPHLSGLLVDESGRIWAKRYDPASDAIWLGGGARPAGGWWWIAETIASGTGSAGSVVATIQMPDGFAPLQVHGDRLLGLSTDSLGVQRVEVRSILR